MFHKRTSKVKIGAVVEGSFRHTCHVECDPNSSVGLKGLPIEWEEFLLKSKFPKEKILKNPEAVLLFLSRNSKALGIGGDADIHCIYTSKIEAPAAGVPSPIAEKVKAEELTCGTAAVVAAEEVKPRVLTWANALDFALAEFEKEEAAEAAEKVKPTVEEKILAIEAAEKKAIAEELAWTKATLAAKGLTFSTWDSIVKHKVDLDSEYPTRVKVGEGEKTTVYVTTIKDPENMKNLIALKSVRLLSQDRNSSHYSFNVDAVMSEIMMMKLCLSCSQIVHHYEAFMVKDIPESSKDTLWITVEYMAGFSLRNFLSVHKSMQDSMTAYVMREMLLGLEFVHRNRRIHRDIRSAHVLLSLTGDVKLNDFGRCAYMPDSERRVKVAKQFPFWLAPEFAGGKPYSTATDIWGLGITAIECAEGVPPRFEKEASEALWEIMDDPPPVLHHPEQHSPLLVDFIECCLHIDPKRRSSASALLEHPFIGLACQRSELIPLIRSARANVNINDGF